MTTTSEKRASESKVRRAAVAALCAESRAAATRTESSSRMFAAIEVGK